MVPNSILKLTEFTLMKGNFMVCKLYFSRAVKKTKQSKR